MIQIMIIVILVIIIALLIYDKRRFNSQLADINKSLSSIGGREGTNQVFLNTTNINIRLLLSGINKLLEDKHKIFIRQQNTETAMKKMLTNISHDLKTPLTVIVGYSEILTDKGSDIDKERYLKLIAKISNKSEELLITIDEFFSLTKLEAGDINFELEMIDINEVCRESILNYYDKLTKSNIRVIAEIPEEKYAVYADISALKRILDNIISNAIRYGYEGKVIGILVTHDQKDIIIEVWDEGKGIPDTESEMIFERLYTLEDSRNKDYQGSGLGLAITKKLVESMGGSISVKSKAYVKTSFFIRLPKVNKG